MSNYYDAVNNVGIISSVHESMFLTVKGVIQQFGLTLPLSLGAHERQISLQ